MKIESPLPDRVFDEFLCLKPDQGDSFLDRHLFYGEKIQNKLSRSALIRLSERLNSAISDAYAARAFVSESPGPNALENLSVEIEAICRNVETTQFPPFLRPRAVRLSDTQLGVEFRFDSIYGWLTWMALLRIKGQKACKGCGVPILPSETGRPREFCCDCGTSSEREKRANRRKVGGNEKIFI